MRSVFVSQLAARVTDRELAMFFDKQAGTVREAKVITDRISRRSKGSAPVLFVVPYPSNSSLMNLGLKTASVTSNSWSSKRSRRLSL